MKSESTGAILSTVFVDYDNIYMSLRRKSEEAAKRFAKDSALWLREIESGRLITPTNGMAAPVARRVIMSRCYGNPVPRRNANDNSTDMNSFPFVRHHFLRSGFEVIDCPPLTAQLKNSADIRMVMDVRDFLNHETRFDEFVILSGDADFTPVLHRLRAHARRTVVFANDHTAAPYTAISDGEVRESDLISLLLEGRVVTNEQKPVAELRGPITTAELEEMRKEIIADVVGSVRSAAQPVPLEALADRAVRALGHDKTVGSSWGGAGSFRDLLLKSLPADIKVTDAAPFFAFETTRQVAREIEARAELRPKFAEQAPVQQKTDPDDTRFAARPPQRAERPVGPEQRPESAREVRVSMSPDFVAPPTAQPRFDRPAPPQQRQTDPAYPASAPQQAPMPAQAGRSAAQTGTPLPQPSLQHERAAQGQMPSYGSAPSYQVSAQQAPASYAPEMPAQRAQAPQPASRSAESATQIQQSIARIHEACQAPPLSPPEYRVLFEVMAEEINTNNLSGAQTLVNIGKRALEMGLEVRRDDIRFVLEVVSEADPWFEQGASANLFASRFRNFVVSRCRSQGLTLTADEIDLVDAWFGGAPPSQRAAAPSYQQQPQAAAPAYQQPAPQARAPQPERWQDDPRFAPAGPQAPQGLGPEPDDEFPRIVRSRLRG